MEVNPAVSLCCGISPCGSCLAAWVIQQATYEFIQVAEKQWAQNYEYVKIDDEDLAVEETAAVK